MENNWVDFKAVKAAVSMKAVLDRYGVNWLRKKGNELRGRCPIHQGEGQDTFHANLTKNAFHCFSCHARGNVLDFVAAMEQCSVRDAALKLKGWFTVPMADAPPGAPAKSPKRSASRSPEEESPPGEKREGDRVNKPLSFELRGIDPSHPYLTARGISRETIERFGAGFFSGKGSMAGRVVIPIRNERGELVAYAGRAIDGTEPKYKFPAGFHKSLVLYNLDQALRQESSGGAVIVVEGFFDCMKVWQAGYACVALMGSSLSQEQEELLCQRFRQAVLMFDGDEAGQTCTEDCLKRLASRLWVRVVEVPKDKQPDQFTEDEISEILASV